MTLEQIEAEFNKLPIASDLHPAQYGIITKFYRTKITELLESTKLEKRKHIIDQQLYEDSGGGSMCEVCGRQGLQLDEDCMLGDDFFNYNQAVADQHNKISQALNKESSPN